MARGPNGIPRNEIDHGAEGKHAQSCIRVRVRRNDEFGSISKNSTGSIRSAACVVAKPPPLTAAHHIPAVSLVQSQPHAPRRFPNGHCPATSGNHMRTGAPEPHVCCQHLGTTTRRPQSRRCSISPSTRAIPVIRENTKAAFHILPGTAAILRDLPSRSCSQTPPSYAHLPCRASDPLRYHCLAAP